MSDVLRLPSPGSSRARQLGCVCPRLPLDHPLRVLNPGWDWVAVDCPVHYDSEAPRDGSS